MRAIGPLPEHIVKWSQSIEGNIGQRHVEAWERAPAHMVDNDAYCVDTESQAALTGHASAVRTRERDRLIGEMRAICADIWGMRGKARFVQKRWFGHEKKWVPLRTIQHYFKITRP